MVQKTSLKADRVSDQLFDKASDALDVHQYRRAFLFFGRAARLGHQSASNNLGVLYSDGKGTKRDALKAIHWYRKAARKGDIAAISNLGIEYALLGNRMKALTWLGRAARRGDGDAWLEIAKIYAKDSRIRWRCLDALESALASSSITNAGREEARCLMRALRNVGTNLR